jgi:hypothetical protein
MSIYQVLLGAAVSAFFGLLSGIIGGFIGFHCWPALRRRAIWKEMRLVQLPIDNRGALSCRVHNGSPYTMGKAVAYLTLDHTTDQIVDAPPGRKSYVPRSFNFRIRQSQLCWEVQEGGMNPMRVDIYAGEEQPLTIGRFREGGQSVKSVLAACGLHRHAQNRLSGLRS